jgi:hypothetical protein
MTFDWTDFLSFADALVSNPSQPGPEEAALRSAASRAYFGAFCLVRDWAHGRSLFTPSGGPEDHSALVAALETSAHMDAVKIAGNLRRLRVNRNTADYDRLIANPQKMAAYCVGVARNVAKSLRQM